MYSCVCVYIYIYNYIYLQMYTYCNIHIYIYICMYIYIYLYILIYMYIFIYINIYSHAYIYIYIGVCVAFYDLAMAACLLFFSFVVSYDSAWAAVLFANLLCTISCCGQHGVLYYGLSCVSFVLFCCLLLDLVWLLVSRCVSSAARAELLLSLRY